jgi:hypothetical protein
MDYPNSAGCAMQVDVRPIRLARRAQKGKLTVGSTASYQPAISQ